MFEVLAQSGAKRFLVHSGILAAQSKPLKAVISGAPPQESPSRTIDLQEWDEATVGRFVEFLYVGHYQAPDPKHPLVGPESAVSNDDDDDDDTCPQDFNTPATAQSVVSEAAQSDRTETIRSGSPPLGPRPLTPLSQFDLEPQNVLSDYLSPGPFDPAVYDFGDVLLAHARVYFLAQDQEVDALRRLAYRHLLSTLRDIGSVEPGWRVGANIVELLRYVYSRTGSPGGLETPLRSLVLQFVALNFLALQSRDEMTGLIREGGELASDLMARVCKRLVNSESICMVGHREADTLRVRVQESLRVSEGRLTKAEAELVTERATVSSLRSQIKPLQAKLARARQDGYYYD